MSTPRRSGHEAETETIPALTTNEDSGNTLEMPAVDPSAATRPGDGPQADPPPAPPAAGIQEPPPTPSLPGSRMPLAAPPPPAPGRRRPGGYPGGALPAHPIGRVPGHPAGYPGPGTGTPPAPPGVPAGARPVPGTAPTHPAQGWRSIPGRSPWRPRMPLLIALAAGGLALVAVLAGLRAVQGGSGTRRATEPAARDQVQQAEEIEPASVSSVDPTGGSGFRRKDTGLWTTQTYTTPQFGNLKSGVGLLLDLGQDRAVSQVSLRSGYGAVEVELRAGDDPGDPTTLQRVGEPAEVSGTAELPAGGERHRYWLVWVTGLAPHNGGFAAAISDLEIHGPGA